MDVCRADGGNHGSLGVPSKTVLKQPMYIPRGGGGAEGVDLHATTRES